MAVDFLQDASDIDIGMAVQSVDAETFEQAVFERLLTTGPTLDRPSNEVEAEDIGDTGGVTGRRRIARGGNLDLPMHFRYEANKTPEAGAFRDTWATEFSYTGAGVAGDVEYLTTGIHADTTTGLQIKTALNGLSVLKNGVGRGLLVLNAGWATGANNQPFMVKDVHDDGSNDLVDIYAGYGGGGASDPFGAPKTAEDAQAATLFFGEWIKNRRQGGPTKQVFSVMLHRYQLTSTRAYEGLLAWVPNDYTFEIPDEGSVRATVTGIGRRWLPTQATPLNGQPEATMWNDPINRDFVVGGEDLEFLSVVTFANDLVPTEVPILLADKNVTNFSFNLAGGVEPKSNILGITGVLPKRGRFGFNGSLGFYVADDQVFDDLMAIGHQDTHQKAAINLAFKDPAGNWKGLTLPRNEFGQTGGEGGTGDEVGTLEFGSEAIDNLFRTAILQQWAGPIE